MQSAIQKAKRLMKAKKAQSASAKARTRIESISRTQDNDTDTSALELKEFIELESKMKKMSGPSWWSAAQSQVKKTAVISTRDKGVLSSKQPFIGQVKAEQAQNKLRESLEERLGAMAARNKEKITKSALTEYSKQNTYGAVYQDLDKKVSIGNTYRKSSFVGFTEKASPVIKSKAESTIIQPTRDSTAKRFARGVEVAHEEKLIPQAT